MSALRWAIATLFLALATPLLAQDIHSAFRQPGKFAPVPLQAEVKTSLGLFTALSNHTFKPAGDGPFAAVVLMHTCGGIHNPHMREHGQSLLAAGYVVLMLDSFEPRGQKNCSGGALSTQAGVVDAYAALHFLARQAFVDPARIYQAGYSWGGLVSALLASPQSVGLAAAAALAAPTAPTAPTAPAAPAAAAATSASGATPAPATAAAPLRFAATVAHYATCTIEARYPFVLRDLDRPLLMLLGEQDSELPPASCFPLLQELQAAQRPVHWQVLAGASHGWDKRGQADRGYVYNAQHTQAAMRHMRAFFEQAR